MSEETTPKQGSGLAVAGLVLGIIAAVTSFIPIVNNLSAILAFIGFILALIALIGALRGKHTAKGISIAGVALCVVSFIIVLATQSAFKAALDKATTGSQPVASSATSESSAKKDEGASKEEKSSAKEEKPAEQKEQSSEQKSESKDYTNLAVGETVTLDNGLSVTVNSVDTSLTNYDDSPIVGINVTYANNSSENESFNPYDWKGEDANGAQRTTTYYSEGKDSLNSGTLSAGGTVTGNLYFEGGTVRVLYYSNMFNDSATAGWNL